MGAIAEINRTESFGLSLDDFKKQEELVLLLISRGINHAHAMKDYTDYYSFRIPVTSFRRALTNMEQDGLIEELMEDCPKCHGEHRECEECKGKGKVAKKVWWPTTKRHVTAYKLKQKQMSLFNG